MEEFHPDDSDRQTRSNFLGRVAAGLAVTVLVEQSIDLNNLNYLEALGVRVASFAAGVLAVVGVGKLYMNWHHRNNESRQQGSDTVQ